MRKNMRGGTTRLPFKVGDVVLVREEIGTKKGEYRGQHVITHGRPHAKSYFCKDLETGRTYLRNQDCIKLDPTYNPPEVEAKTVKLICDCLPVPLRGILKTQDPDFPSVRTSTSMPPSTLPGSWSSSRS